MSAFKRVDYMSINEPEWKLSDWELQFHLHYWKFLRVVSLFVKLENRVDIALLSQWVMVTGAPVNLFGSGRLIYGFSFPFSLFYTILLNGCVPLWGIHHCPVHTHKCEPHTQRNKRTCFLVFSSLVMLLTHFVPYSLSKMVKRSIYQFLKSKHIITNHCIY